MVSYLKWSQLRHGRADQKKAELVTELKLTIHTQVLNKERAGNGCTRLLERNTSKYQILYPMHFVLLASTLLGCLAVCVVCLKDNLSWKVQQSSGLPDSYISHLE